MLSRWCLMLSSTKTRISRFLFIVVNNDDFYESSVIFDSTFTYRFKLDFSFFTSYREGKKNINQIIFLNVHALRVKTWRNFDRLNFWKAREKSFEVFQWNEKLWIFLNLRILFWGISHVFFPQVLLIKINLVELSLLFVLCCFFWLLFETLYFFFKKCLIYFAWFEI